MLTTCHKKKLSLIVIIVALHFTVAAQTDAGSSRSKDKSHRSIITNFFKLQASVRYVYQTTLNAQGTAIASSSGREKGQAVSFITFSNPDKVIKISTSTSNEPSN